MAMNFWQAQQQAKRRTKWILVAFLALTAGVAVIADSIIASFWPEYAYSSIPWVGFGFIAVTILVALYNYSQYQTQGGAYVAQSMGARSVNRGTPVPAEKQLLNIIEEIAVASGLPMPKVFILKNDSINAFAAGTRPENACICVTSGCMALLNRDELQSVIAHEFGHIYNGDVKLSMRLAAMLMGFFIIFYIAIKLIQYAPPRRDDESRVPIAAIALVLTGAGALSWVAGKILSSMISRQREYLADASSVQFTRNPEALASALMKIEKESHRSMPTSGMAFSHLYFDHRTLFGSLFSTHPPLKNRIKAILGREYLPNEKTP